MLSLNKVIGCCGLLVLLSGCRVIDVGWNHLRIGVLESERTDLPEGYMTRESTVGFSAKWAPDVDWAEVWKYLKNEK